MGTRDGRVKVLDFGLAKFQQAPALSETAQTMSAGPVTSIGKVIGTSAYMSPEQAEGRRVDHRSDVFSLGILLYEMATGVRPFTGDTALSVLLAIVKDASKPITQVRPGTSLDLERIIDRCLEKDPERRLQSARESRTDPAWCLATSVNLWVSRREHKSDPFGEPMSLDDINGPIFQAKASISGFSEIFWMAVRPEGFGDIDIYYATRPE